MIVLRWKTLIKSTPKIPITREIAIKCLVKAAQRDCFHPFISSLTNSNELPKRSPLAQLSPILDSEGILRVGGRLARTNVPFEFKHLMIVSDHPLVHSLVSYLHVQAKHQGGRITAAAIRQAGYFLIKGGGVVRQHIKNCFLCQKFRGKTATQLMADLPSDRLEDTPPFQSAGVDCFGPFYINKGKVTCSSLPTVKIWVVIFVCLPSGYSFRAIRRARQVQFH